MINVGIIGAGRIGRVHAENIKKFIPHIKVKTIAEIFINDDVTAWAKEIGIDLTANPDDILNDPEINAVLICSSTDTHSDFIIKAAQAGKDIFCEKPIDHDIPKIRKALDVAKKAGVKLQIGFARRFDHNHSRIKEIVKNGDIGEVHIVKISSRDTAPASIEYLARSGGIFYDMMIHDFDMARFLADSEVVEVFAQKSVLVDKRIGELGDWDTAIVTLKFANGAIGVIDNSRKAVYGYDQRVEVFGSKGYVSDENDHENTVKLTTEHKTCYDAPVKGMWDRYQGAFVREMELFADALSGKIEVAINAEDGLYPVIIAEAATRSAKEHRPVLISEIVD